MRGKKGSEKEDERERGKRSRGGPNRGLLMLNHSPSAHHLATIVLQDAGCTIVDLTRAERERGEGGKRRGDGGRCCHGNRTGARLTSKPGQRGERERSHGSCPPGWEGRVRASCHPILYRPAGAVTQIVEDMRLCYFSGFQGRVYANNVFAFIVVVVLGFLFVFCSRLYLRLTLKIKNYFADIVLVS